jgi:hypothetical protein
MVKIDLFKFACFILLGPAFLFSQENGMRSISFQGETYPFYPELLDESPEMPSPYKTDDGREIVVCFTRDGRYCLIPVTVENGDSLNYKRGQWYGKGMQLVVDTLDFPVLAETGLHSEEDLDKTSAITGRPVEEITRIGRPGQYSEAGFMGHDETIISVLKGDNRLVRRLEFTHPLLARPLFHVFNIIQTVKKDSRRGNIGGVLYNERRIGLKFWGAKGWQESIFNDEVLGYWEIEMWRELNADERSFLDDRYGTLTEDEMTVLTRKLTHIHTGEMAPFYIMRYGFYEGHTGFRADPLSIASVFGLKKIRGIDRTFPGDLYHILTNHFTE